MRQVSNESDTPPFRWSATVVWDRCLICDRVDSDPSPGDRAYRRFPAITRTFDQHINSTHAVRHRCPRGSLSCALGGEGGFLAGAAETHRSRTALRYDVAVRICERDQRVVERCDDVRPALRDELPFSASSTSSRHSLVGCSCWTAA